MNKISLAKHILSAKIRLTLFAIFTFILLNAPWNLDWAAGNPANLMTNPCFESDFQGWINWGDSFIETDSVHSGSKSIRVGPAAGGSSQRFENLVTGNTYTMWGWSRLDNLSTPAWVGVDIFDTSGTVIGNYQWIVSWTSWQQQSVTFVYPSSGADYANIWVWTDSSSSPVYVYDYILVECSSCAIGNVAPSTNFSSSVSKLTATFADSSTDSDGTITSRDSV